MLSLIDNLSVFTWMDIIESNEKCISFLENLKLIPKRTDQTPPCPKCSCPMYVHPAKKYVLGWHWACKKRMKREDYCGATVNPLKNTFFAGTKLPLADMVALIFGYILNINDMKEHMACWRRHRNQPQISTESVSKLYAKFDQIILSALCQRNETFGKLQTTGKSRGKLLKKYSQTMDFHPVYRNIVYQFLMDMKHQYPGYKPEVVSEHVGSFASTSAANTTNTDNNLDEHSSETGVAASSVSTEASANVVHNMNVVNVNISTSERNKTLPNNSKDIGSNLPTSNASPVLKSSPSFLHNVNVRRANTSGSEINKTLPDNSNDTSSNLPTSTTTPVLNSAVKNASVVTAKTSCNTRTANPSSSKGSDLSNHSIIPVAKDVTTGNENNIETENLTASNNAALPVTVTPPAATPVLLTENSTSNSSLACVIVDSIVHNILFYEEQSMDIDHVENVNTT